MMRSTHVRCTVTGPGAILFDTERGKLYNLNSTGAEIWKLLDEGLSGQQIIEAMVRMFPNVPTPSIEADVTGLLRQLSELQFVTGYDS